MNIANTVLDAIEILQKSGIDTAKYNTMIKAQILSCKDEILQKYSCRYQDSYFEATTALPTGIIIPNNTQVFVIIPNNDFSQNKKILGTVESLGEDFILFQQEQQEYEIIGINTLKAEDDDIYYLDTDNINYSYNLYKYGRIENDIDLDIKSLNEYISQSSTLFLGATIKTNIDPKKQNRGHYGITCTLIFNDTNTNEEYSKNYTIDEDNMIDNPYRLLYDTKQYQLFDVDGINFVRVDAITIFNKDFPYAEAQNTNRRLTSGDIIISNIQLCGAVKNTTSNKGLTIGIETPQGTFFTENAKRGDFKTITAYLKIDGKRVKDTDNLSFYWGRQNMSIFQGNAKYNTFLGRGWQCLNQGNQISEDVNTMIQWIPADDTYSVSLQQATAKDNNIKVAIVYKGKCITKIINIKNYGAVSSISIESSGGQNFHYGLGHPTLTCLVDGNQSIENYHYYWVIEDSNGIVTPLLQTTDQNDDYNILTTQLNIIKENISNGTVLESSVQERKNELQNQLKQYDLIQRVQKNKIYDVQIKDIISFATFKCSVESLQGIYLGTASITLINSLQDQPGYSLVINNGDQVFQYNEDGVAPNNGSLLNPQLIPPLSFSLYDQSRNLIDSNIIKNDVNCFIKWKMPIKNTLLLNSSENGNSSGIDETLSYLYYDNLINFIYDIQPVYNSSSGNNQIELTVKYNGLTLTAKTNFTFVKQGQPGTNGTNYIIKIVPNTRDKNFSSYPMIIQRGNDGLYYVNYGIDSYEKEQQINLNRGYKLFKAQIWKNGTLIWEGTSTRRGTGTPPTFIYWEMLINNYGENHFDASAFSIDDAYTGQIRYNGICDTTTPNANILRCHIIYEGKDYYGTIPIITASTTKDYYNISLKDFSGFRYVTYTSSGMFPQYSNAAPFTFICQQKQNNVWNDISTTVGPNTITYSPGVIGNIQTYNGYEWKFVDKSNLLQCLTSKIERMGLATNEWNFQPISIYNGQCVNLAITCMFKKGNQLVGYMHIPIHFLLNKYGLANINAWDGNSIQVNEQGGFILSPQIGSGIKDNNNNFTGILMGSVKESGASSTSEGLFAYGQGVRSFFLNAKNGSAIFGKNHGKMTIDPTTDKMMIYSSNYWQEYNTEGLPLSYNTENQNNQGLLIDLSTPQIKYGSGNFSVDNNGILRCQGAIISGSIALTPGSSIDREVMLGDVSINDLSNKSKCITEISNTGVWVTPIDSLPDQDGSAIEGVTSGTKIDAQGVGIYNYGTRVALYGESTTIGADDQSKFHIESNPDALVYTNAQSEEIFSIKQNDFSQGLKNVIIASYASDQNIQLDSEDKLYVVIDDDMATEGIPSIKLKINDEEINFSNFTYSIPPQQEGQVKITFNASQVEEIENYRQYEVINLIYELTQDSIPYEEKVYYKFQNNEYVEIGGNSINYGDDEQGITPDNPHDLGWFECRESSTIKLYACEIILTYSAYVVTSGKLYLKGNIETEGIGNPIHVINNDWQLETNQSDTFIRATNSIKNTSVSLGIDSGGENHGVYSHTQKKWLINYDMNGKVWIPANLTVQNTVENIETQIKAVNKAGDIYFYSQESGDGSQSRSNRGIYTHNSKGSGIGILYVKQNNNIVINTNYLNRPNGTYIYGPHTTVDQNNKPRTLYCFGNNQEITRFATRTTGNNVSGKKVTGLSFMIANGYYAVGSAQNNITSENNNVYISGGFDGKYFLRSLPVYSRTYSSIGTGHNASNAYVCITNHGTFGRYESSSIRYKNNIEYLTNDNYSTIKQNKKVYNNKNDDSDILAILNLPIARFKYNEGYFTGEKHFDYNQKDLGLIAEDVAKICPECATYMTKDNQIVPESYNIKPLVIRMLYVIQKQQKEIEELKQKLT